jgi:Ca2+-transporting ATPase
LLLEIGIGEHGWMRTPYPEAPDANVGLRHHFGALTVDEVVQLLETEADRGLEPTEAAARLATFGSNDLPSSPPTPWWARLTRQMVEPMAVLLIVAAAVAGLGLRERLDAVAILVIVALNALIGFAEEGKAARALEALRSMEAPMARIVRAGTRRLVPIPEIVPGDLVQLAAGDRVPADLRITAATTLEIDESVLTGESLPVEKDSDAVAADVGLADQHCMAFTGTHVTRGSARGIVVATGSSTALGKIAADLVGGEAPTPLQRELRTLTARLGALAIAIAAGVFGLTLLRTGISSESVERSFLASVALAVAAVPEGLATVVTVALALGVRRMAARGAIVRRLPAVETLGSTTVILTDKTGTLTENHMELSVVVVADGEPAPPKDLRPDLAERVSQIAILCNDATLEPPTGDPIDIALLEAFGDPRARTLSAHEPRIASLPFDSARRRMTTLHRLDDRALLLVKGAPETVLELCSEILTIEGEVEALDERTRAAFREIADELAARGMRTLVLARRELPVASEDLEESEHDLAAIALVGLRDPIRVQAPSAVKDCREAGISLVVVTGDHPGTAASIAQDVGLLAEGGRVLTGTDIRANGLPDDPLSAAVYARVDPDQKLALVESLQASGHVVAVTGDGVNDAPALRRADIGVAMGRTGSDVAREASDMVITDDDLATIVVAVREGRGIYDNIRKVIDYLVAGNLSEIAVVVLGLALFPELGVPLLPLQLLWVNLLTDGLPAVALGVDPPDPSLMTRPPRPRKDRLLAGRRSALLAARGGLIASFALGALVVARFAWDEPWDHARAVMFTVLVLAHLLYAFVVRAHDLRRPPRWLSSNGWLLFAVATGIFLQLLIVAWPAAHELFGTAPLTTREWVLVFLAGVSPAGIMLATWPSSRTPD